MPLMNIYSTKKAAELEANGAGEYVDSTAVTPPAHPTEPAGNDTVRKLAMPLTGHALPLPNVTELTTVAAGGMENYVYRVAKDAGWQGTPGTNVWTMQMAGMLTPFIAAVGGAKQNGTNWPEIADRFWDAQLGGGKYQPAASATQWANTSAGTGGQAPAPPAGGETPL